MSTLIWGGYPRISEDPLDLRSGIGRQYEDITSGVVSRGGVAEEIRWYPENDTSAYKKRRIEKVDGLGNKYVGYRVIRPVWQQALADLRARVITALMVWDLDRLARDPRDLEDAIEVVTYYGARIESVKPGEIDLTTDSGIAMARVLVAMNAKSSADTARRVKRVHLENARTGKPVGGTRPFGWEKDKVTVRESEAQLIRLAAVAIIEGVPLRSITHEWNAAGVKSSRGAAWRPQTVRQMLKSPRLSGWRVHQGKVATDKQGKPVRGQWEPILDQETHDQLLAVLSKPDRRARKPRRGGRHYLLTGLVRCGICFAVMYGNRTGEGRHYYVCNNPTWPEKHTVGVSGVGTDELISELVWEKMAEAEVEAQPDIEWHGEQRLEEIDRQVASLMTAWREGRLPEKHVFPEVTALEEEAEGLRVDRADWLADTAGPVTRRMDADEWASMEMDRKRAFIDKWLDQVVILPATQRGNRLDPERVVPGWRTGERAPRVVEG